MIWFQMFKRFISTNCFAWAWSKWRVTHFPLSVYYLYQKVTLLITLILDILKSNPLRNRFHVQARTIFNWLVLNVIRDFTSQGHLRLRGQTKPKRALVTCGSACLRRLTCFLPCVLAGSWWQYPFYWLTVVFSLILVSRHSCALIFSILSLSQECIHPWDCQNHQDVCWWSSCSDGSILFFISVFFTNIWLWRIISGFCWKTGRAW